MNILDGVKSFFFGADKETATGQIAQFSYNEVAKEMKSSIKASGYSGYTEQSFDGSKFLGGFGDTKVFTPDYWTLRTRSEQLFHDNVYARGLVRRLVTNEINTGLTLEATPNAKILGQTEEALNDWSDNVEDRFSIWAKNKKICDFKGEHSFGGLQRAARTQAIISGDVLIVVRFHSKLKIPQLHLVSGNKVRTPFGKTARAGNIIKHGVELDARGRHVAYWVTEDDGNSKRVPARGEKSGRRLAWLMYGSDRLLGEVRGMPLLSLVMQSLKELDRYRDAELRAAVVNATIAAWVKKEDDKPGTKAFSAGAIRNTAVTQPQEAENQTNRTFAIAEQLPGAVIEELQTGESPQSYDTSRPNVNFGAFEAAVAHALAWANECPPEIYLLSFNNNYSASRAAINEFKLYLNKKRMEIAEELCEPVYEQWLLAEVLTQRIQATDMVASWRNPEMYHIYGAWISSDWGGAIKPSVDLKKEVQGYKLMEAEGWITNDRASKELTGTKFSKNMQRRKKEVQLKTEMLASALTPILELEKQFGGEAVGSALDKLGTSAVASAIDDDAVMDNVVDFLHQNDEGS